MCQEKVNGRVLTERRIKVSEGRLARSREDLGQEKVV